MSPPSRRLFVSVVAASFVIVPVTVTVAGCGSNAPPAVASGIFAPLGDVMPRASSSQRTYFELGRDVALRPVSIAQGLGPSFNATRCVDCHERPVSGGGAARTHDHLLVAFRDPDGTYVARGSHGSGVQAQYATSERGRVADEPSVNVSAIRNAAPFFGVGVLAEVSDDEILRRADPDDADRDGISGRANTERGRVGRFGRKAQSVSLEGLVRATLFDHLGVTSLPLSTRVRAYLPVPTSAEGADDEPTYDADPAPDPELREPDLYALVSYVMLLAAPQPDAPTPATEHGAEHFDTVGCASCHTPALSGPRGLVPAYTDLLLHDMGASLADGIQQGSATGSEFRTPPLWGVAAVSPYLHDGRASTVDEAIRLHDGEASAAREAYVNLGGIAREELLAFLASLGGRSQRSDGLLPPGAPLAVTGELGAPQVGLAASELESFTRGRAVFDRDLGPDVGLGPRFDGDSCRACHSRPVIGGSGPIDVDVIRHGTLTAGVFFAPSGGTVLHRHDTSGARPAPATGVNYFEPRQTPALFGLGLVDRIPEATLFALADPSDADLDGISGRAHVLADGRVGRFGWKADIPTLEEYLRDELSVGLGITVPQDDLLPFGSPSDTDPITDPELGSLDLADLLAFVAGLAAPSRQRADPALESVGGNLFAAVGCAGCHVPLLMTGDGQEVRAFSDFLLHDVAPPLAGGVAQFAAGPREFRTPPLWGIAASAPYMHHGRAATLRDAIAAHATEGDGARVAFAALTAGEQAAVLAFLGSI